MLGTLASPHVNNFRLCHIKTFSPLHKFIRTPTHIPSHVSFVVRVYSGSHLSHLNAPAVLQPVMLQ